MKHIFTLLLIIAVALAPAEAWSKRKVNPTRTKVDTLAHSANGMNKEIAITNAGKQLSGQWTVMTVNKKEVKLKDAPYIYLDFRNNTLYGNNGCNYINGNFSFDGGKAFSFSNIVTSKLSCANASVSKNINKALNDTRGIRLTRNINLDYITLLDKKGNELMTLKRQNLEFMNGLWVVKEVADSNIIDSNIYIVIDMELLTVNASSGCNIINGLIQVDNEKDFAVEFLDLTSTKNECPTADVETQVLIALEETELVKKVSEKEIALLNKHGKIILVLRKASITE